MSLHLLEQLQKRSLKFKNRVFMAPMTRSRAPQEIPTDLMCEYYAQRAEAGLIFSEGSQISKQGIGYIATPGIYNPEQVTAWKKVTDNVHQKGGLIFCQLWHVGRVSHPDFHDGALPVAPSAISFTGQAFTFNGVKDVVTPRELTINEINSIIQDYKNAAQNAKDAGFDGVEIHAANGYLPAQFLEDGSNHRTDIYGGSIDNRARFLLEITDAVISIFGANNVSVRLSPRNPYNGMSDSNPKETYLYVIEQLEERKIGILHLMESYTLPENIEPLKHKARQIFSGILVLNFGYDKNTAEELVSNNIADAISFGSLFISNPDLPTRFATNATLTATDKATFYGGSDKGYTDYPMSN